MTSRQDRAPRHHWVVRLTHWANVPSSSAVNWPSELAFPIVAPSKPSGRKRCSSYSRGALFPASNDGSARAEPFVRDRRRSRAYRCGPSAQW